MASKNQSKLMKNIFKGTGVALITPFKDTGEIDFESLSRLVKYCIEEGVDFLVTLGTTAESATLSEREKEAVVRFIIKENNAVLPVLMGIGGNNTKLVCSTLKSIPKGVDGVLCVTPYYNKPNQKGLFEHYKTINDAVDIPQILYNVPSRTNCDLENETIISLSQLSNIVGIKDATGELERIDFLKEKVKDNFIFISGDDLSFLEYMERGGCGVISVTANVKPDLMHNICNDMLNGDVEKSRTLNKKLSNLHQSMFVDSNPIPVKWLMTYLGLINKGIRLPLVELDSKHQKNLIKIFEAIK